MTCGECETSGVPGTLCALLGKRPRTLLRRTAGMFAANRTCPHSSGVALHSSRDADHGLTERRVIPRSFCGLAHLQQPNALLLRSQPDDLILGNLRFQPET